jgi:hypothetical protein
MRAHRLESASRVITRPRCATRKDHAVQGSVRAVCSIWCWPAIPNADETRSIITLLTRAHGTTYLAEQVTIPP